MSQFYKRQLDNGQTVYFSLVNKQSQRGFTTNKRLFLMLQNQFICYLSSPKVDFPLTIDYISKHAKLTVVLKQITKLTFKPQKNAIHIQFWILDQGKRKQKYWILELDTPSLMNAWQDTFEDFSNRSRKGTVQNINPFEATNNVNKSIGAAANIITRQENKNVAQIKPTQQQALEQQLATSQFLLKEDREYFSNIGIIQPSPSKDQPQQFLRRPQNFELSKLKDRKDYFNKYGGQSTKIYSFTNYYRPYIDDIIAIDNAFLRQSQLEQADRKYTQFIEFAEQQVVNLIDYHLQRVVEAQRQRIARQSVSDKSGIIRYTEIQDIIIEFGFVQLQQISNNIFVCDDILNKLVLQSFKNLQYLYQIISKEDILKSTFFIPMACIINFKGYECVVYSKIDPTLDEEYEHYSEDYGMAIPTLFNILSQASRIDIQMFQDERNVKIIPRNIKRERFAILSANHLLPELQLGTLLRRQTFSAIFNSYTKQTYSRVGNKGQIQHQNAKICEQLQIKQRQLSSFLNKLQIYPISPQQTAIIFHSFGVNIKHLAKICNSISQSYILSVLKTEAALRVFKTIFRKKIQDNLTQSNNPPVEYTTKQFLNLLMGKEEGTVQLWKVISLHTQKYFNLHVQMAQINKGYFFLGLSYHLSVEIFPSTSNIDNIFRTTNFVEGVKFYPKIKAANILPTFMRQMKDQIEISLSYQTFQFLDDVFWLKQKYFPQYVQDDINLYSKILYLCSFYIKPNDQKYLHLKIYQMITPNEQIKVQQFNSHYLKKKLTEIRWLIKSQSPKEHIIVLINKLKQTVQNFYGKCHPFISQICQLQSLYYLQLRQREQAININKQSLANMIKCCGNNTKHIKISNNYYQMAECLLKCHRVEQSLINYKKAMNILQMNNYQELPEYAHILYKIGMVTLHLNKDSESYDLFVQALRIYENNSIYTNWTEIVHLYQLISRCQSKAGSRLSFIPKQIKLAQHIVQLLQKTQAMELEFQVCTDIHFIRMLKIVVETYMSKIKQQDVIPFRQYLIDFCDYLTLQEQPYTQQALKDAILYFKNLIAMGNFLPTLQNYISNTGQIMSRMKNEKLLQQVRVFRRNDFLQGYEHFIRQLIELLGETFLLNILK